MKRLLAWLLPFVGAATGSAMGVALTLDYAIREADAIVHCRIIETAAITDAKPYGKVATAVVISSAKGPRKEEAIRLLFDNGLGCPNVSYAENEEVLVFARQTPAGTYETLNLYCGRFAVADGVARSVYLFSGFPPASQDLPVAEIIGRIKDEVRKTRPESGKAM